MEILKSLPLSVIEIEKEIRESPSIFLCFIPEKEILYKNDAAEIFLSNLPNSFRLDLDFLTPENPNGSREISVQDKHFECHYRTNFEKNTIFLQANDITKHKEQLNNLKQTIKELEEISTIDKLTGLYNKACFDQEIKKLPHSRSEYSTILSFDLDQLKVINDVLGHQIGDLYLIMTGKLLKKSCRETDHCFHISGDEFTAIFPNMKQEHIPIFLENLKKNYQQIIEDKSFPLPFLFSIGFATFNKSEIKGLNPDQIKDTIEALIKQADDNMYKNKINQKLTTNQQFAEGLKLYFINDNFNHSQEAIDLSERAKNALINLEYKEEKREEKSPK